jgi:Fur family ferric uptake transcriptional regulator
MTKYGSWVEVKEGSLGSKASVGGPRLSGRPSGKRIRFSSQRASAGGLEVWETVPMKTRLHRTSVTDASIERLCVKLGLKMTGQRRTIARVLSAATDHPDVEEVYRRAVGHDNRISIATVYRTVRLFEEKGILNRWDFGSGRARFEANDHGPHHHLIDVDTGKVIEFENPEHERLIRKITAELGFEVVSLRLEIFGRQPRRSLSRCRPRGPRP